ncbi:MAG: hypothetical protein Q9204_003620 [Flavoplaca sp. TL-2023a]
MGRVTRQQAKIREAEGIPPSPPTELPNGGTRRRKRAPNSTRTIIAPETIEDASSSSQQDQTVPEQTLREGNAGGYVHHAQNAESTREQQYSLSDADLFLQNFTPDHVLASAHQNAEAKAASLKVIHRPTPSPSNTSALFAQILHPLNSPSPNGSVSEAVASPNSPSPSGLAPRVVASPNFPSSNSLTPEAVVNPHSPSSNGLTPEPVVSPNSPTFIALIPGVVSSTPVGGEQATAVQSVSTQTDRLAASVASPNIHTSPQSENQTVVRRDASAQTNHLLETFKEMGRYGFNSGIAVMPEYCNITLHLGDGREIRINRISDTSIRLFGDMLLEERDLSYERNWLTYEELAELEAKKAAAESKSAAAAEATKLPAAPAVADTVSSENKRKRDEETEMPEAQRRRINPSPTPALKPIQNSARRMHWARRGNGMGKSLKATQLALARGTSPADHDGGPYNTNGELQLSRNTHSPDENDDPFDGGHTGSISATTDPTQDTASHSDTRFLTAPLEGDLHDESAVIQYDEPPPQTPQRGSWLPSVVTSALRYVPSIRRRHVAPETPQAKTAWNHRVAQTEPRRPMPTHSDFGQRLQTSQLAAQKTFRSKENIDTIKKVKAERERISFEWAKLEEERKLTEEARRIAEEERKVTEQEKQDVADAHRAALSSQPTGSKRRRASPRVIPNPKGVSYGLDLDFFYDSDSEEEQEVNASRKSRRTSGPEHSSSDTHLLKTPNNLTARANGPYTSPSDHATTYTGSRFADSPPNVFGQSTTHSELTIAKDDPRFNHSGHFEIPWSPSSSEGDSDEEATPIVDKSQSVPPPSTQDTANPASESTAPTSSPPKLAQGLVFPPVTPAQKFGGVATDKRWDPEAAKTLERNRELLRAKMAGQSRSVLSPKDIQYSPSKPHVSSPPDTQDTPQTTAPAIFFQPQQANAGAPNAPVEKPVESESEEGGFSILGAASRTSPKSTAQKLTETLPFVQERLNGLQSYSTYQQTMDPKAMEYLESLWNVSDETAAIEDFRATFTEFDASRKQDLVRPGSSQSSNTHRYADDDDAIDDEDHESLYDDEDGDDARPDNEVGDTEEALLDESEEDNQPAALTLPTPTAFENFTMDPKVAEFLNAQWTAEDEAYASDEFKNYFASTAQPAF